MALTDNLVSYWKLDESSGTRVDSHGSNDLTDNNTVGSGTGKINNGADFEASNSEFLNITDASQSGLDLGSAFSISFWINPESAPGMRDVVGKWDNAGDPDAQYLVRMTASGGNFSGVRVQTRNSGDEDIAVVNFASSLSNGTFYHIVVVFSGGSIEVYKDGSSEGTAGSGMTTPQNGGARFALGARDTNTGGSGAFDGILDEVGIWSVALTSDDVTALYNGGDGLAYPLEIGSAKNPLFSFGGM